MKKYNENTCLDLTLDKVFKAYFKDAPHICISLLRHFLPLPKNCDIQSLKYMDSTLNPKNPKDKESLLDIRVKLDNGASVNIEMQTSDKQSFKERILFYLSRLYTSDLVEGGDYHSLCPVYSLIFTDFIMFEKLRNYHSVFFLKSEEQPEVVFSHHLGIILVELKKFKERAVSDLIDKKDIWSYIIKNSKKLTSRDMSIIESKGSDMKQAVQRLKMLSRKKSMQIIAEAREKARRDRVAERAFNIQEGRAKGIQKGRLERNREVILNMLKKKLDISTISEVTGLSEKEIKKLKNSVK